MENEKTEKNDENNETKTVIENEPFIDKYNVKLIVRYIIISVLFYIGWSIIDPEWINSYENKEVSMAIVAASWGALTFVIKSTFEQKIDRR